MDKPPNKYPKTEKRPSWRMPFDIGVSLLAGVLSVAVSSVGTLDKLNLNRTLVGPISLGVLSAFLSILVGAAAVRATFSLQRRGLISSNEKDLLRRHAESSIVEAIAKREAPEGRREPVRTEGIK